MVLGKRIVGTRLQRNVTIRENAGEDEGLLETTHLEADTTDPRDEERVIAWWEDLTGPGRGGEGMVGVKPLDFVAKAGAASRNPVSSAAGGSTSGSSTARSTRHRRT
jgi:hypothetical protein